MKSHFIRMYVTILNSITVLKGNPFATEYLLFNETQLPVPERKELVTQLTISESELEEELQKHLDPERNGGLQKFVTAPSTLEEQVHMRINAFILYF